MCTRCFNCCQPCCSDLCAFCADNCPDLVEQVRLEIVSGVANLARKFPNPKPRNDKRRLPRVWIEPGERPKCPECKHPHSEHKQGGDGLTRRTCCKCKCRYIAEERVGVYA